MTYVQAMQDSEWIENKARIENLTGKSMGWVPAKTTQEIALEQLQRRVPKQSHVARLAAERAAQSPATERYF